MSTGRFAFQPAVYWSERLHVVGAGAAVVAAAALLPLLIKGASANTIDGDGHGLDSPGYVAALPADKRVEHDFASGLDSGDDCLEATGYDPIDYKKHGDARRPYAIGAVSEADGVIRIVPGGPDSGQPALELRSDGGEKPLQPANEAAAVILARLGCELQY